MSVATPATVLASLTAQESGGAIKNKTNAISAKTINSPDAEAHRMTAGSLSNLQDQINALLKSLRLVATFVATSSSSTSTGTVSTLDVTLVAASTTTINPTAPTVASFLTVFVKAKGATALLAWGANTKWAPTEFTPDTDTWTVFNFNARIDPADSILKWFYIGPSPVTGQS